MKKILGIGNALVDILISIDDAEVLNTLNLPRGSMTLVDRSRSDGILDLLGDRPRTLAAGGSAANTIHGIGKLGATAGFIGVVGKDVYGDFFIEDMSNAGTRPHMIRSETFSGRAIALVTPDSERTFATCLGAAVELGPELISKEVMRQYDFLHLEGYLVLNKELLENSLKMAREAGITTSLDMASYNVVQANLEYLKEIIHKYIDIVFANEEEAFALTGKDPENALAEIAAITGIAVVKTGEKGSLVRSGDTVVGIEPVKTKVVDTTGAGDLYASGFLYGLMNDLPLSECGRFGSIMGSSVIGVIGAKPDAERWRSIKNQISR